MNKSKRNVIGLDQIMNEQQEHVVNKSKKTDDGKSSKNAKQDDDWDEENQDTGGLLQGFKEVVDPKSKNQKKVTKQKTSTWGEEQKQNPMEIKEVVVVAPTVAQEQKVKKTWNPNAAKGKVEVPKPQPTSINVQEGYFPSLGEEVKEQPKEPEKPKQTQPVNDGKFSFAPGPKKFTTANPTDKTSSVPQQQQPQQTQAQPQDQSKDSKFKFSAQPPTFSTSKHIEKHEQQPTQQVPVQVQQPVEATKPVDTKFSSSGVKPTFTTSKVIEKHEPTTQPFIAPPHEPKHHETKSKHEVIAPADTTEQTKVKFSEEKPTFVNKHAEKKLLPLQKTDEEIKREQIEQEIEQRLLKEKEAQKALDEKRGPKKPYTGHKEPHKDGHKEEVHINQEATVNSSPANPSTTEAPKKVFTNSKKKEHEPLVKQEPPADHPNSEEHKTPNGHQNNENQEHEVQHKLVKKHQKPQKEHGNEPLRVEKKQRNGKEKEKEGKDAKEDTLAEEHSGEDKVVSSQPLEIITIANVPVTKTKWGEAPLIKPTKKI